MTPEFNAGMAEATQLTRAGRLDEASAMIQRLLGGGAQPPPRRQAPPDGAAVEFSPPLPAREAALKGRGGLRATLRRLAERARALDVDGSGAAPAIPEGARFEAVSHRDAAGSREYKLYVPASAREATGARPLVVMLHGCTQNPDDFARGTGMNAAAEAAGVLVAYPGQPSSANPNRCWNWFRPEDQRRGAGEAAIIAGIARAVTEAEGVDPSRVFIAGMSAGGAAAAAIAAEYPEIFAAAGVHSGLPHGAAQDLPSALGAMRQGARGAPAARPVRTIVFHGDADRVVNPANAAALAAQAAGPAGAASLNVERGAAGGRTYSRALHADAEGRTLCEQWTIDGAGHAWAGGDASGSHTDAQGPDASREMLRFFLEA